MVKRIKIPTETKTAIIQKFMLEDNWPSAIRHAARLPSLGKYRNDILDAHGAYTNPNFYIQIGKDPSILIENGKKALIDKFGLSKKST